MKGQCTCRTASRQRVWRGLEQPAWQQPTSHVGFAAWVDAAPLLAEPWFAIRSTSPIYTESQQHSFGLD